jgi:uncharacterized protein with HEPN domain
MSRHDLSYLTDILQAARLIEIFIQGVDKQEFYQDLMRQSAVIRQIEIIGEATKRLSDIFRNNHPEIPWRSMAGMRDILIHAYDHVDLDEVWNTATLAIPDLIQKVEALIPPE